MRRVDLNLLYILRELLKEPNTTKVGDKLGLTQSAVSASLGRLRWAFQDDLFVRSGRAMAPTRRAEALLDPVEDIISRIESLLEEVHFDPSTLQRTFVLAATDFVQVALNRPLAERLQEISTSVKVIYSSFYADTRARARSGHLDLMLAPVEALNNETDQLSMQELYTDRLVVAVCADNPAIGDSITADEYLAAGHIEYNPLISGNWQSTMQRFFVDSGVRVNVVAEFNTLVAMMHGLRGTNLMATVPGKLVEVVGPVIGIRALELPFETDDFTVYMHWNRVFDSDPEHQWFRTLVQTAAATSLR